MPLCGQSRVCPCAVTSASLSITGDGSPGSPFAIEGAAPTVGTRVQRLALAGVQLWEGRQFWETDTRQLWEYSIVLGNWMLMATTTMFRAYGTGYTQGQHGRLQIVGDSSVVITDASGYATINYGVTFLTNPLVSWVNGDSNVHYISDSSNTLLSSFVVRAFTSGGAVVNVGAVRVNWTAIGMIAA
jgi:hypothetical protein